jgi:hypothetical protein
MYVFGFRHFSFWRRCFVLQIDRYEAFRFRKCYASSWIRKVHEAMSHYTHAFWFFCACQNHQFRHHRAPIVAPSNVKKCDVNEDRTNRSPKGGGVQYGKIQHLRASIARTSLGKSLFDVFCVFFIFARRDISSLSRLHCVYQTCISGGVFFDALTLAFFGRCKSVEIWRLSFLQTENATSSQFRASEAHFRVSSCVVIYSTCGPFWP